MRNSTVNRRVCLQSMLGAAMALSASSYVRAAGANERFRAAVIGRTGRGNYGHSLDKVWRTIPDVELVAVADDDSDGLSQAAARLKLDKAYTDYRTMLDREKPDVVCIAQRWIDRHHEMAMACAERGIHMYMEKPFVRTLAEADELVALCERNNVKLALACQSHYSPKVATVKQLLAEGAIGQVLEYRARGKEDQRGGSEDLWVLGTHLLDLIRLFGGQPQWCFAKLTQDGAPIDKSHVREGAEGLGPLAGDRVDASYGLRDGAKAYFASCRNAGNKDARFALQIFGSKGVVEVMTNYMAPVHLLADPTWSPGRSKQAWVEVSSEGIGQPEPIRKKGTGEGNRVAVTDLLSAVREGREPLCGMHAARGVLEMIHAAFESHRIQNAATMPLANREHPLQIFVKGQR